MLEGAGKMEVRLYDLEKDGDAYVLTGDKALDLTKMANRLNAITEALAEISTRIAALERRSGRTKEPEAVEVEAAPAVEEPEEVKPKVRGRPPKA